MYIWNYVSAGSTSISVALIQIQSCTKATLSLRKVCLAAADESKPPASLVQLFEPGKEEPLLLGWTRLSMMNACPSKEVFSCYSGLHWISSIVSFLPSLLRIWPGTRVSMPTQRSTFASPFQQSRHPLTKQQLPTLHKCLYSCWCRQNTKLQLE